MLVVSTRRVVMASWFGDGLHCTALQNNKRMRRIVRQLILKDENMAWEKIWFLHSVDDNEILPGSTPVMEQDLTHQGILEGFAAVRLTY